MKSDKAGGLWSVPQVLTSSGRQLLISPGTRRRLCLDKRLLSQLRWETFSA